MPKITKTDISLEILRDSFDRELTIDQPTRQLRQSEHLRRQETIIFSNKEKMVISEVQNLQSELTKLASSVKHLNKVIGNASIPSPITTPGTYHINFLEHLIVQIKSLTKNMDNASEWMSLHIARGKKKSHYWGQVKKSGSKYLLSADRYMSTQAG